MSNRNHKPNVLRTYNLAKVGSQTYLAILSVLCVLHSATFVYSSDAEPCAAQTFVAQAILSKLSFMAYMLMDTLHDIVVAGRLRWVDVLHHLVAFMSCFVYLHDCSWQTNMILGLMGTTEVNTVCLYMATRASYLGDHTRTIRFCQLTRFTLPPCRAMNAMAALCVLAYSTFGTSRYSACEFAWFSLQCIVPLAYYTVFSAKVEDLRADAVARRTQ